MVWAVMSVLSIWLIRPKLVDLIHKGADIRNSNADALIGKIGKVVETIPANGYGYIQVDGDQWKSKSIDDADIALGEKVEIVERESIIMTVRKIKNI
jgi:membrane protein implicated in regulation of membrane protease activity